MTTFIEKLVAEIIVSLCVGAVLGVVSGAWWTPEDAVGGNRRVVCRRCRSDAMIEGEGKQVRPCDEHQ
jgi:hypothetical protein